MEKEDVHEHESEHEDDGEQGELGLLNTDMVDLGRHRRSEGRAQGFRILG